VTADTLPIDEAQLPRGLSADRDRIPYRQGDVRRSIAKITAVSFHESVELSAGSISVTPVSSGFAMGACNWIIKSFREKICYLGASTAPCQRHPLPLDHKALTNCDAMIVSSLSLATELPEAVLPRLCGIIEQTARNSGHVLLPVASSGVLFDLLDGILAYLKARNLQKVRVFFVSPIAKRSMGYSAITGNWLNGAKQTQVFTGQHPFSMCETAIEEHTLTLLDSLTEVVPALAQGASTAHRQGSGYVRGVALASLFDCPSPCVVLCGHPCLRFGPVVDMLLRWGRDIRNALVLTEPAFCGLGAADIVPKLLAADQGEGHPSALRKVPNAAAGIRVIECPLDPELSPTQLATLVAETRPKRVVVPSRLHGVGGVVGMGEIRHATTVTEGGTSVEQTADSTQQTADSRQQTAGSREKTVDSTIVERAVKEEGAANGVGKRKRASAPVPSPSPSPSSHANVAVADGQGIEPALSAVALPCPVIVCAPLAVVTLPIETRRHQAYMTAALARSIRPTPTGDPNRLPHSCF
jgi:hypothetical protein